MVEFFELTGRYAPQYLPFVFAVGFIIFTKTYVYKDMVPIQMLTAQLQREKELLTDQVSRERNLVEGAKSIEQQLCEIVRQLESLTKKVSEQIHENTERLASVEHCVSDLIDQYHALNHNFELHRKGVDTETFRKERP